MVRIAAVGDVHFGEEASGSLASRIRDLDVAGLLIAGDLTATGRLEEAQLFLDDVDHLDVPAACVLGNHEYHHDQQDEIRRLLESAGITVLEGSTVVWDIDGCRVGIAGVKGFGGGFLSGCASDFGEPLMKRFVAETRNSADALARCLGSLDTDLKIALLHYAPIEQTCVGEPPPVYPFLGSYLLGDAIDRGGADMVVHGHAHMGHERGFTPGGIPVLNAARTVMDGACGLIELPSPVSSLPASGND